MKRMNTGKTFLRMTFVAAVAVVFAACSTQKNTFVSRNYHSITTKYNGFFNARESYRKGVERLSELHVDNYGEVLKVFTYGTAQNAQSVAPNMDVAYKKASIAIQKHSMFIRNVEYNRWIDDCYFLIGRAQFFKRDYNLSILTFEYIIRLYKTPLAADAKIWIAKNYNELGLFDQARPMLESAQKDVQAGNTTAQGRNLFYLAYADHFLKQKNYQAAIPHLNNAIKNIKNKRTRERLMFILAQSYEKTGNAKKAIETYTSLIKRNPSFDMAFQAKINLAMAYDQSAGDSRFIKNELNKMLRDKKNKDHFDQIYYAMAQIELREKNTPQAVDYLLLSTSKSTTNTTQKGVSFLKLGEIHFQKDDFVKAQVFYDSAVVFLPREYNNIKDIAERKNILNELARHLNTVTREDSLQRLARMPAAERNAIVDQIIEKLRIEEEQKREEERQRRQTMMNMAQNDPRMLQGSQSGGWYFYNTATMTFGRTEFLSKWGDRKLEDNWRLSQKNPDAFDLAMDGQDEDEDGEPAGSPLNRQTYLRNIPLSPEQMSESNSKIERALYNQGLVFQDKLHNRSFAIQSFETLLKRFSETEFKLNTLYYLHTLHKNNQNHLLAEAYKNRIINEFPDSDFAKILLDPLYYQNIAERASLAERIYARAYEAFKNEQNQQVLNTIASTDTIKLTENLQAKFSFLNAITLGRMNQLGQMEKMLSDIITNHKDTELATVSQQILEMRRKSGEGFVSVDPVRAPGEGETTVGEAIKPSPYKFNPNAVHFYVMIVNSSRVEMRTLRADISDFNSEFYRLDKLTVSNIFLDDKNQILTISNFQGKDKGLIYRETIKTSGYLTNLNEGDYQDFVISVENYPIFYKDKNIALYLEFFEKNYLNK